MGISRWAADMFCLASSYSRSCRYSILVKERSIVMSMPVCLSVCLCLCLSISPELHVESSPRFSACYLWPWLGPAPDIRPDLSDSIEFKLFYPSIYPLSRQRPTGNLPPRTCAPRTYAPFFNRRPRQAHPLNVTGAHTQSDSTEGSMDSAPRV